MKLFLSCAVLAIATPFLASSAPADPAAAAPAAARATFQVDPGHSSVLFKTKHVGVSYFYGRFNQFTGTVVYDPENPEDSSVLVVIDAASVDTNSEGRDRHLKSADFFSVQEFPEILFESTSVEADGEDLRVTGDLTFHGVTKELTTSIEVVGAGEAMGGYRAGFQTSFEVDMRDFGVDFVEQRPDALGPTVQVIVSLETIRG